MNLLIPVDSKNKEEALLTKLDDIKNWAFIEIEEGKISSCNFFNDRNDIQDWVECVVVQNEQEYVWPFIEENIMVLVAPSQRTITEIVEAFLFRELHDLAV